MSLSSRTSGVAAPTGRVVLGIGAAGPQETTVAEIEARRSPMHFERMEAEFWERVRAKAQDKAREIMAQAMAEAERLKASARAEGLAEGTEQARVQFDAHLDEMGKAFAETLAAIQKDRKTLWASYQRDFTTLLRLALEKTLGILLDERRRDVLGSLLDEALDVIDSRTELTVTVNPDDAPMIEELLSRASATRQGLERWRVKGDASLTPGGVRLESRDGMADNTVDSRFAEVAHVFDRLSVGAEGDPGPDGGGHGT
ncbi:FliH/SctL family protein [Desulfolutivibrio sulfoxidireducens]|uniref:FliH/SctL family protein n=1 Tax=Desulfolutivibrio sulfoxidireducens TaxID=2773299 RepID=UPI00159EA333|nr:FliH/SctL family protein [Desulfolutivibrio sulfoxidireducens]QLA17507.1 flagellar assembly protein FliH [Desulfolutivibrio sulfoxidireducens]